ncbi:MobA/MobL family protein [Asaia sp. HN010]|uniref:MobA/MobL family protein n=1 Tax=Asaia sp. HN010 TaxID=3081233 RepID=UPI0038D00728
MHGPLYHECLGPFLQNEYLNCAHDFSRKEDVVHSKILMPAGAPKWLHYHILLWNEVEVGGAYKDAGLARKVVVAISRKMSKARRIALARFVRRHTVD